MNADCPRCHAGPRDCRCRSKPPTPLEQAAARKPQSTVGKVAQKREAERARKRTRPEMLGAVGVVADGVAVLALQRHLGPLTSGEAALRANLGDAWRSLTGAEKVRAMTRGLSIADSHPAWRAVYALANMAQRMGGALATMHPGLPPDAVGDALAAAVRDAMRLPGWVWAEATEEEGYTYA